jgi:hypothetical protein
MSKCNHSTEIYSRVCGYHRPIVAWNAGKQEEFADRKVFNAEKFLRTEGDLPVLGGFKLAEEKIEQPALIEACGN